MLNTLIAAPAEFDLFQAVRLLEQLRPDLAPVGFDWPAAREAVRLRVRPNLAPPRGGGIDSYEPHDAGGTLWANVGGLVGPGGALPDHYTALVMRRVRQKDATLRDFLDLFQHRLLSLLYRAWRRRSAALTAERSGGRGGDEVRRALLAIAGFSGPGAAPGRLPEVAPPLAGLFARRTRTAAGLAAAVDAVVNLPVAVEPLAGQWLYLDAESRCRLGAHPRQLGVNAVLGRRVWDRQGRATITVGPVNRGEFDRLSRPGPTRSQLEVVARTYAGVELDLDVTLSVAADQIPPARLVHREKKRPRLGRDVWLLTHRPARPADDATFRVGG